jgi:hypothetical protein
MLGAADISPTVNSVATVIAAAAALVTIYFARKTVEEAKQARREQHRAHGEEMSQLREAAKASAAQHRAEMDERQRAYAADLVLRRLAQLEKVSGLLLYLVEVARSEYFAPSAPLHLEGGQIVTTTRLPAIQARLRTAVAILKELGGPDLTHRLPPSSRGDKDSSQRVWYAAIDAMIAIELLAGSGDDTLTLLPSTAA